MSTSNDVPDDAASEPKEDGFADTVVEHQRRIFNTGDLEWRNKSILFIARKWLNIDKESEIDTGALGPLAEEERLLFHKRFVVMFDLEKDFEELAEGHFKKRGPMEAKQEAAYIVTRDVIQYYYTLVTAFESWECEDCAEVKHFKEACLVAKHYGWSCLARMDLLENAAPNMNSYNGNKKIYSDIEDELVRMGRVKEEGLARARAMDQEYFNMIVNAREKAGNTST